MPLTLGCICEGAGGADLCLLQSMTFHYDYTYTPDTLGYGAFTFTKLKSSGPNFDVDTVGSHDVPMVIGDWLPVWASIYFDFDFNASASQGAAHYPGVEFKYTFYIKLTYLCTNLITLAETTKEIFAINSESDSSTCVTGPGDVRSIAFGGPGNATGFLFKSTPLGDCNGPPPLHLGDFRPDPNAATQTLDITSNFCLCATGGTGTLRYYIVSGQLPCGQTLNATSGCIEGAADGTCLGTDVIVFGVMDSTGATAESTCNLIQNCGTGMLGAVFY